MTGIHVLIIANCDGDLGITTFNGKSLWMNPYGHLSGDEYGYIPLYRWMFIAYCIFTLSWQCIFKGKSKYFHNISNCNCISWILILCLVEMSVWYLYWVNVNATGIKDSFSDSGLLIFGVIVVATRCTVTRIGIIAVANGLIVYNYKQKLCKDLQWLRNKMIVFSCIYWIASAMFNYLNLVGTRDIKIYKREISGAVVVSWAIIELIFWGWIFKSLNMTIKYLQESETNISYVYVYDRGDKDKLQSYQQFRRVMIGYLCAAIVFGLYTMYVYLVCVYVYIA